MSQQLHESRWVEPPPSADLNSTWEEMYARERARRRCLERQMLHVQAELQRARLQVVSARQMALRDELTALPNRTWFRERLRTALAASARGLAPVAVLYLDLDGFKQINDTYGHAVGDKILNIVAMRLARSVRAEDTVSRLGGDEFGCLLTGFSDAQELRQRAGALLEAVSARVKIGAHVAHISGSAGIATAPADGTTVDELLRSADAAMYRAKNVKLAGHQPRD